jgi:PAS domain S-box-containing protein
MSARPRLRLWVGVGSAVLATGALALALILTSNHAGNRVVNAVLDPLVGWSFALSGLVAWSRRPNNGTGRLLVLVSFAWFASLIADANNDVVFTVSQIFGSVTLAVFAHLLLAYPEGRLDSRLERFLVFSGYALAIVANATLLLVYPRSGCPNTGACPKNLFLLTRDHTLRTVLSAAFDAAAAVLIVAIVLVLIRHWHRSSPARKRFLRQIYVAGVAALLLLAAGFAAEPFSEGLHQLIVTLALLVFATLPFFFLAGVLNSRLARGGVAELLVDLRESATPLEAQEGLRRVLRDPELQLAVWQPERGGYDDVHGRPFELAAEESAGRVTTLVASEEGRRLAAFVHDPALLQEPELLEGVVAVGRLALHRDRLQTELQARLVELERERDFIRDVVNAAPAFFVVIDLEGRVVRFNDTLVRASGIADDERVRGQPCRDVFAAPADRAEIARLIAEAAPGPHEHRWLGAGGAELVVEWSLRPIADAAGRPRLLLTGLDVSQRVRQEAELRDSRARIVEAGDAERRRLERNLHDGAQQRLVSLSLALRLAKSKLLAEPERADGILTGATGELALALEELRELARGIHPAVLTDRGLGPALESLAESSTVPVELEVPGERLPPAVEAAAFYVVSEALANIAKYAHASGVRVALTSADGSLDVVVADDGIGGADPERGSGLRGLVDRVEALGGRLELASPPGRGTRVHAALPLGVHEAVAP